MPDGAVAHVLSDPPYSERTHARLGKEGRSDGYAARADLDFVFLADPAGLVGALGRLARRWILLFCDEFTGAAFLASDGAEWVRDGSWLKPDAMPQMSGDRPSTAVERIAIFHAWRESGRMRWNSGGKRAVWTHPVARDRQHPTEKPVSLMAELVEDFTDPNEVVLDPFAGSGTTGVACLRLGRRCILVEKSPVYAALARERMKAEERGLTLRDYRAGQMPLFSSG